MPEKEKIFIEINDIDDLEKVVITIYNLFSKLLVHYYETDFNKFYQLLGRFYLCLKNIAVDFKLKEEIEAQEEFRKAQ